MPLQRRRISIEGAVQGVGFRPFIYKLATKLSLVGYVANTTNGVTIEAQGHQKTIEDFLETISVRFPPLAHPRITSVETVPVNTCDRSFAIRTSQHLNDRNTVITPDAALCRDCLRELADPNDRRHAYPFINCTNCGPRYTIIFDVPYDRPQTTMRAFRMCPQCQREYDDPDNRRFHAQPNACPLCGPHVWLTDGRGQSLNTKDAIAHAVQLLEDAHILAVKGLGGFHLAVRADDDEAVHRLRVNKYRKAKAFAVMVRNIDAARHLAIIDRVAEKLLTGIERPIVLCPKKRSSHLSDLVAPASRFWGIMLPYTPLHTLLMAGEFPALVMTSANNTDEPIEKDNDSALERLSGIADFFLMHNRDIYTRCDDSVVKPFRTKTLMIRRARGYVPHPLPLDRRWNKDILAVGAELKNTITYVKGNQAFVSQHIGDLADAPSYESFRQTVEKLGALVGAKPQAVACDLHPALLTARFAQKLPNIPLIRVQHHHAHLAAVMAEQHIEEPVVGLATDGFGYGPDDTSWGGELLICWRHKFERRGHWEKVPLPGGDAASRQPWRMALSYLLKTFDPETALQTARRLLTDIGPTQLQSVVEMIRAGINSPLTSSLGRLFDAVSALTGVCSENTYDAQAAIELENLADPEEKDAYPVTIVNHQQTRIIMAAPAVKALVQDLLAGVRPARAAAKFHNFVVAALTSWTQTLAAEMGLKIVALAGGVFQNDLILAGLVDALQAAGLRVCFNEQLPLNDGAISFGQAVVADALLAKGAETCVSP